MRNNIKTKSKGTNSKKSQQAAKRDLKDKSPPPLYTMDEGVVMDLELTKGIKPRIPTPSHGHHPDPDMSRFSLSIHSNFNWIFLLNMAHNIFHPHSEVIPR